MTIKRGLLPFLTLTITLIFSACFSPWKGEQGTVTVNVGSGNKTVPWLETRQINIDDLLHIITITGPGPKQEARFMGEGTAFFTTAPGTWKIDVKAYYDQNGFEDYPNIYDIPIDERGPELVAAGSSAVDVKAGKSNRVSITMGPAEGGEGERYTLTVGTFKRQTSAWNNGSPYNYGNVKIKIGEGDFSNAVSDKQTITESVQAGTTVTIRATYNYGFSRWVTDWDDYNAVTTLPYETDDAISYSEITFTITENTTLYAVFDGDGVETPKNITSAWEMARIGSNQDYLISYSYALMADLDFDQDFPENYSWTPIGTNISSTFFTGTFDGRGHLIHLGTNKVKAASSSSDYIGLFGYIGTSGTVKNLKLEGSITYSAADNSTMYAGAVAGHNLGTINNVVSSVSLTITNNYNEGVPVVYCGGIAGQNGPNAPNKEPRQITNCAVITDKITATTTYQDGSAYSGGIAGRNNGFIDSCWTSAGEIKAIAGFNSYAGGIAGSMGSESLIENCVALNTSITSSNTDNTDNSTVKAGRIVGWKSDNINSVLLFNYATTMTVTENGTPVLTSGGLQNSEHGADFSNATNQTSWMGTNSPDWTFSNLNYANESSPWVWGSDNKPKLWFEIKD
jgi:hypothetical protein